MKGNGIWLPMSMTATQLRRSDGPSNDRIPGALDMLFTPTETATVLDGAGHLGVLANECRTATFRCDAHDSDSPGSRAIVGRLAQGDWYKYDAAENNASVHAVHATYQRTYQSDTLGIITRSCALEPEPHLSEDPLAFEAGINFYVYVGNNPVNRIDPSGQSAAHAMGLGAGALYGGVSGMISGGQVGFYTVDKDASLSSQVIHVPMGATVGFFFGSSSWRCCWSDAEPGTSSNCAVSNCCRSGWWSTFF